MSICSNCVKRIFGTSAAYVRPSLTVNTRSTQRLRTLTTNATAETALQEERRPFIKSNKPETIVKGSLQHADSKRITREVKKELTLALDPYHIAEHVKVLLNKGDFQKALAMTREASRRVPSVVSWNHLIDYQLKHGSLRHALGTFNEMKKRAQFPNAQTYTIIFRGCARHKHPKLAVAEAVKIYLGMIAGGRIQPSIIHMNALLFVCSMAKDLEAVFTVLKTAGPTRKPDATSYSIILAALRYQDGNTYKHGFGAKHLGEDKLVQESRRMSIERGRSIWSEVISRWRNGEIVMDEGLVSSMGSLLHMGDAKSNQELLNMLKETMGLPMLQEDGSGDLGGKVAAPKPSTSTGLSRSRSTTAKLQPGNKTLSLLMQALSTMRRTKAASRYWTFFREEYKVVPDQRNWEHYLAVLAKGHASKKYAECMAEMPAEFQTPTLYREALYICVRDALSKNAFDNATQIFDLMMKRVSPPSPAALKFYLQAATGNHKKFYDMVKPDQTSTAAAVAEDGSSGSGVSDDGSAADAATASRTVDKEVTRLLDTQIFAALDRLWDPTRIVMNGTFAPSNATTTAVVAKSPEERNELTKTHHDDVLTLVQKMVSVGDKLISQGLVDWKSLKQLRFRRTILQNYVARVYESRGILPEDESVANKDGNGTKDGKSAVASGIRKARPNWSPRPKAKVDERGLSRDKRLGLDAQMMRNIAGVPLHEREPYRLGREASLEGL